MDRKSGKPVAIVTAAGRGIGAECARAMAHRGYAVSLLSRSVAAQELAKELGGLGMSGSITDPADLDRLVTQTVETYGRLDALIHNTGHAPRSMNSAGTAQARASSYAADDPFEPTEIEDAEWLAGFGMMFLSAVRLLRLSIPVMRRRSGGSVVLISTFAAFEPRLTYPVSSVIRAALSALVKLYADRYGREGVRINAILPGFLENWDQPDEVLRSIPLGRRGALAEIGETAAFLTSPAAGYITGQSILVDGGVNRSI